MMLLLLEGTDLAPRPDQAAYWVFGLLLGGVMATLFWQLIKAKDDLARSLRGQQQIIARIEALEVAVRNAPYVDQH